MISQHRYLLARLVKSAAIACVGSMLAILSGCASAPADTPAIELPFPSPISGPGRPSLDRGAQRHIDAGWQSLIRGDNAGARSSATQSGDNSAANLLELQSDIVERRGDPIAGLVELTAANPDYAAAWLTLSAAAEKADNEALALSTVDRGATLWSNDRWRERADSLRKRWVDDRIAEAGKLLENDQPTGAISALAPAMALEPGNKDAVILKTRSLIALDQPDRAEAALAALPPDRDVIMLAGGIAEARGDTNAAIRIYSALEDDPDATMLAVSIAESQGDWQTAMNLYNAVPDSHPEKAEGLRKAKLRWRLSVMPPYVQDALTSMEVDRAQLAVLLVILAPRVETLPGGQVPLLSDIVDMPSQREIVTATRLGLLQVDRLDHRFYPQRAVSEDELRSAITNLGSLMALEIPRWCTEEVADPCTKMAAPLTGEAVADIVIDMVVKES